MLISVLVSTYNQPEWLEKVLWGLEVQTDRGFEVVVADDGSSPATAAVVRGAGGRLGVPLRHEWQDHTGFGKCAILNRAIRTARGDYLLFLDGDCIPRRDLVAVHRSLATPGYFLSGGALRLPMPTSRAIGREDIVTGRAMRPRWLLAHGARPSLRLFRIAAGPRTARWLDRLTTTRPTFNGGNGSVWRQDALHVNGFDERMGHGGLDREFGERLENAGIRGRQVRHRAIVLHLDHERAYRNEEDVRRNEAIRRETRTSGRTRAERGIGEMTNDERRMTSDE